MHWEVQVPAAFVFCKAKALRTGLAGVARRGGGTYKTPDKQQSDFPYF